MVIADESMCPLYVCYTRLANMSGNASASSGIGDDMDAPSATQQVKRSKVWEHFEKDLVVVGDVPKVVCKYCGIKLTCTRKSGTSSLLSHISEYCRLIEDEVRVSFVASLKKKASDVGFIFNSKRSRQLMTKFCIHAEVAFRKFEDPYFEEWMESMQPTFKVVGRHTIRNDCILEHDEMKDRLKLELETLDSRICLTSDMWTSVQKLGYMCVTAHYIDANFDLFRHVNSSGGRTQSFNVLAKSKGLPEKAGLVLDLPHRWNTTFYMLVEAIKYKAALNSYASENGEVAPNVKEWDNAEVICDFLRAFEEATNAVSADRKPTSHLFLHMILCIRSALRDPQWKVNATMYNLSLSMDDKFEKYWKESNVYPVLSAMARDFLAIPLSTVSSESAFSCGGRVLGDT